MTPAAQFRPFRRSDLGVYIEMRVTLEMMVLDLAWPRLVDEELQAIDNRNRLPANLNDRPTVDNSLHACLIETSTNRFISEFFDYHRVYYNSLFNYECLDRETRIQAVLQLRDVLESLSRRDRPAAERACKAYSQ